MLSLIDRLAAERRLTLEEYETLIAGQSGEAARYAAGLADRTRRAVYGVDVYIRGLIEVGNVCRNDCFYCGIRRSNAEPRPLRAGRRDHSGLLRGGIRAGVPHVRTAGRRGRDAGGSRLPGRFAHHARHTPTAPSPCRWASILRTITSRMYEAGANRYLLRHETADQDAL